MTPETIFRVHLIFGYIAWLLFFVAYVMPKLRSMGWMDAQRAIATLHSFRFFGLVFILPGVVGTLPGSLYRVFRLRRLGNGGAGNRSAAGGSRAVRSSRALAVAFNVVGVADILIDYYHATVEGLPLVAGQLGAAYVIPILYVPLLMITHGVAVYLLLRPQRSTERVLAAQTATS